MTLVEDDYEYFEVTIIVPEGLAELRNIVVPSAVHADTPFDIVYEVHNLGGVDKLWGEIKLADGTVIEGSHWESEIPSGDYDMITHTIQGITEATQFEIHVGHEE